MPSGAEKRHFPRKRTRRSARIYFDQTSVECVIVDRSDSGVGILLRPGDEIPDTFKIEMRTNESPRWAEVVWRSYPRCGVIFRDELVQS